MYKAINAAAGTAATNCTPIPFNAHKPPKLKGRVNTLFKKEIPKKSTVIKLINSITYVVAIPVMNIDISRSVMTQILHR
jgi:hypothetical protein